MLVLLFSFSACQKETKESAEVVFIPSEKNQLNDHTFNQGAYEGIKDYCVSANVPFAVYEPENGSVGQYLAKIDEAAADGAKLIVLPGFNFSPVAYEMQSKYPNINFILIDGVPSNGKEGAEYKEETAENTCSILFAEDDAGYLAGYAVVKEGYRKLGFLGGKEYPAVVRYGFGFIQGAEYAAKELKLPEKSIEMAYGYSGNFSESIDNQVQAAAWFASGTEVIFACGGKMGLSVMKSAEDFDGKKVVGVDSDQCDDSDTVITSATKNMRKSVADAIAAFYSGTFPGGQVLTLGAESGGVGLPIETSRFSVFTKAEYDAIYAALAEDKDHISSNIINDTSLPVNSLPLEYVQIIDKSLQ